MDTFIVWRPWWLNPNPEQNWKPTVERLHCDQNPHRKPGFHCVQGMVPLLPVTQVSGGLQVVPNTNTDKFQEYLKQNYKDNAFGTDWLELRSTDKYINKGVFLEADPGDLILWDSRTIHGGWVGTGAPETENKIVELARMSLTVCMTPRSKANKTVIQQRRKAVAQGRTLTHWPHEYIPQGVTNSDAQNIQNWKYKAPNLTPEQWKLVGEIDQ